MRTILLAMNNPVSSDPLHALFPYPPGCAGHRLWEMLREYAWEVEERDVTRRAYIDGFERRNVLSARTWSRVEAREAGRMLLPELAGRRVVVLGVQTLGALGLDRLPWGRWSAASPSLFGPHEPLAYCCLPHPSGRCREYNDPATRALAGRTLLAALRDGR